MKLGLLLNLTSLRIPLTLLEVGGWDYPQTYSKRFGLTLNLLDEGASYPYTYLTRLGLPSHSLDVGIPLHLLDAVGASPLLMEFLNVVTDTFLNNAGLLVGDQSNGEFALHLARNHCLGTTATERTLNACAQTRQAMCNMWKEK